IPFFLGERYQISRWVSSYGPMLYNEVPLGATTLVHYKRLEPEQALQDEQVRAWGQLLRASFVTQSILKVEEIKEVDNKQVEPVHGLHLLRYADQITSQRDLVVRDHATLVASPEQEVPQARLDLWLRRPV